MWNYTETKLVLIVPWNCPMPDRFFKQTVNDLYILWIFFLNVFLISFVSSLYSKHMTTDSSLSGNCYFYVKTEKVLLNKHLVSCYLLEWEERHSYYSLHFNHTCWFSPPFCLLLSISASFPGNLDKEYLAIVS